MSIDTEHLRSLAAAADKYLDDASDRGLGPSGVGPVRGPVRDTFAGLEAFHAARERINADTNLSPDGKKARAAQLEASTRGTVLGDAATARRRLEQTRKYHEERTQVPRVAGADLMGARHDLDRLTANVKPGELAGRLEFAVRNGGEAVADLVLGDRYPERVILPTRGPEFAGDAAAWAQARRQLVADRLGEAGAPHLRALEAAATAAKGVTIGEHVASTTFPADTANADVGAPRA